MFPGLPLAQGKDQDVPPDDWPTGRSGFQTRWHALLASSARACCCPAMPAVVVLMPPAPGRPHRTDLLLCRHHYRVSWQALMAVGAVVLDPDRDPSASSPQSQQPGTPIKPGPGRLC